MRGLPTPLTIDQFNRTRVAPEGGYDVFEHTIYDTPTYLLAGLAGQVLSVFDGSRVGNRNLTNMGGAGFLVPRGQKFHAFRLFATPLVETTMSAAVDSAGRLRDVERVWRVAQGFVSLNIEATGRTRPRFPLSAVGSVPGIHGDVSPGTAAAQNPLQHLDQIGDGQGYPFNLQIDGGEAVSLAVQFRGDAATPIAADLPIQFALYGWLYVPVSGGGQ